MYDTNMALCSSTTVYSHCVGKRNFYSIANKPAWYPDDVPFRHQITPNISKIKVFNTKYCIIIALVGGESIRCQQVK